MDNVSFDKKVLPAAIDFVADKYPDQIAVEDQGRTLTYSALSGFSNQVAHCLQEKGTAAGEVVGIFLNSSIDYVTGILGVNKAGAIFMPLDINYPRMRLAFILDQIKPAKIVTNASHLQGLVALLDSLVEDATRQYDIIVIDAGAFTISTGRWDSAGLSLSGAHAYSSSRVDIGLSGEHSNYLLFTSGSTGNPKAIEGCHKSLSHFIHWEIGEFGLDRRTRVSQLAPLLFDVSLRDIFAPLVAGGTVVIPPDEVRANPEKLAGWIEQAGITLVHTVPSVFRTIINTIKNRNQGKYHFEFLQFILLAGEPLFGRDVTEWYNHTDGEVELVNVYGPSETTLAKIFNRIKDAGFGSNTIIPLGEPIANTKVLIIKNGKLCEVGEIGEIYIKTPFMSRGYYRDEALTKSRFIQNPLHNDQPDIIYRTGDLGRYDKDRKIEYIGREDSQVKIRGNRVELFEVEKVIRSYNDVSQVVLTIAQNAGKELQIVCYYLVSDLIDSHLLRAYLKDYIPEYMIPSYFVELKEFPLHINGKVNKQMLPRPEELLYEQSKYVAPGSDLEKKLAEIWSEVLNLKKVGIHNSFFDLGGHSLSATRAVAKISQWIQKEVQIRDFLDHPTISRLAAFINGLDETKFENIQPLSPAENYSLSHSQKRLWVLEQMEGDLVPYNIQGVYHLEGDLHIDKLKKAFSVLSERHESLRTIFIEVDNEPVQVIRPQGDPMQTFFYKEIQGGPEQRKIVMDLVREEGVTCFDLRTGPLYRAALFSLGGGEYFFSFTIHHIICDAWSMHILIKEIMTLYEAYCEERLPILPELRVQYKDFVAWQKERLDVLSIGAYQEGLRQFLAKGAPVLELAGSYPRPAERSYSGRTIRRKIATSVKESLQEMGNQLGTSLFMNLLSAVKIILFRYSAQSDIIIGSTFAGREHEDLKDQVGFFANILPLYAHIQRDQLIIDVIEQVKARMLEAYPVQSYPFDRLLSDLQIKRTVRRSPLFDVLVEFHYVEKTGKDLKDISVTLLEPADVYSHFDLAFRFEQMGEDLFIALNYSTELYAEEYILRLTDHLEEVMASMTGNIYKQVGDIVLEEEEAAGYPEIQIATDFDLN